MEKTIKPSLVLFFISGILIIAGVLIFEKADLNYWLLSHSFYFLGVILFWLDK